MGLLYRVFESTCHVACSRIPICDLVLIFPVINNKPGKSFYKDVKLCALRVIFKLISFFDEYIKKFGVERRTAWNGLVEGKGVSSTVTFMCGKSEKGKGETLSQFVSV